MAADAGAAELGAIAGLLAAVNAEPATAMMVGLGVGLAVAYGRQSFGAIQNVLILLRTGKWPANGNGVAGAIEGLEKRIEDSDKEHSVEHARLVQLLEADRERGLAATKTLAELAASVKEHRKATERLIERLDRLK